MSADASQDNAFVAFWRSTGLFETTIPKAVKIGDMRLGLMLRCAQVGTMIFFMTQIISGHSYERQFPATGSVYSSWFERSGIAAAMETAPSEPYCKSPYSFDYWYCDLSQGSGTSNEFWCEKDVTCEYTDPAFAMVKQTPNDIWIYTYLKRRSTRKVASCTSTLCKGNEVLEKLGPRCQCVQTRNSFIAGAEGALYGFRHRPQLMSEDAPSTDDLEVQTHIYADVRDPTTGKLVESDRFIKTMPKGSLVSFSTTELFAWTGLGTLDMPDPYVANVDDAANNKPPRTGNPSFRMTGIKFDLRVIYSGSLSHYVSDRVPSATLKIDAVPVRFTAA